VGDVGEASGRAPERSRTRLSGSASEFVGESVSVSVFEFVFEGGRRSAWAARV